jgi:hypothetical protein
MSEELIVYIITLLAIIVYLLSIMDGNLRRIRKILEKNRGGEKA